VHGDAVGQGIAPLAADGLAFARRKRGEEIVERGIAGIFPVELLVGALQKSALAEEFELRLGGEGDMNAGSLIEPAKLESYAGNKKEAKGLAREYDFFLADTALMPRIGRVLGQYLGPRGKIPTPVPPNAQIEAMINRMRGAVRVRSRGSLGVSARVGDRKLPDAEIADNILAMIQAVQKKLPNGDKNIKTVAVKTTMGKPVKSKVEEG